jgi:hypothetical protein
MRFAHSIVRRCIMERRRCASCGQLFRPRPQVPQQSYCSTASCQRARKRRWQKAKRQNDADYRDNQARIQRAWSQAHREYWREYRSQHPEYCERNRAAARQRQRDRRWCKPGTFAKMDASIPRSPIPSGTYRLLPADSQEFAKMDASIVEITLLSTPYEGAGASLQKTT